jgi:peptidoglycan L-alanyl-D-glutamate endopeptidase CwlK
MSFHLGANSETNLVGVEPGLVLCTRHAILITEQDFGVFEGLRLLERQRFLVAAGASRTLDSYHIADLLGVGHALDNVPYVQGVRQWQTPLCNKVARAMRTASLELRVPLHWGRVWDRLLGDLDPDAFEHERALYVLRYQATHPPLLANNGKLIPQYPLDDPPHFQGLRKLAKVLAA